MLLLMLLPMLLLMLLLQGVGDGVSCNGRKKVVSDVVVVFEGLSVGRGGGDGSGGLVGRGVDEGR